MKRYKAYYPKLRALSVAVWRYGIELPSVLQPSGTKLTFAPTASVNMQGLAVHPSSKFAGVRESEFRDMPEAQWIPNVVTSVVGDETTKPFLGLLIPDTGSILIVRGLDEAERTASGASKHESRFFGEIALPGDAKLVSGDHAFAPHVWSFPTGIDQEDFLTDGNASVGEPLISTGSGAAKLTRTLQELADQADHHATVLNMIEGGELRHRYVIGVKVARPLYEGEYAASTPWPGAFTRAWRATLDGLDIRVTSQWRMGDEPWPTVDGSNTLLAYYNVMGVSESEITADPEPVAEPAKSDIGTSLLAAAAGFVAGRAIKK